jgi:hypothetical protein
MDHPGYRSISLTSLKSVRLFQILVFVSSLSLIVVASEPVPDALASKRLEKLSSVSKIPSAHSTPAHAQGLDPDEALARLLKGNARFVSGKSTHPNQGGARRKSLTASQNPHTIVASGLRASRPVLAPRISKGAMKIFGAVYDLDSGRVSRLF